MKRGFLGSNMKRVTSALGGVCSTMTCKLHKITDLTSLEHSPKILWNYPEFHTSIIKYIIGAVCFNNSQGHCG